MEKGGEREGKTYFGQGWAMHRIPFFIPESNLSGSFNGAEGW